MHTLPPASNTLVNTASMHLEGNMGASFSNLSSSAGSNDAPIQLTAGRRPSFAVPPSYSINVRELAAACFAWGCVAAGGFALFVIWFVISNFIAL